MIMDIAFDAAVMERVGNLTKPTVVDAKNNTSIKVPEKILLNYLVSIEDFMEPEGKEWKKREGQFGYSLYVRYFRELYNSIKIAKYFYSIKLPSEFFYFYGDWSSERLKRVKYPFIGKVRNICESSPGTVLYSPNFKRHWNHYYELVEHAPLNYSSKKSSVVWRGAPTGALDGQRSILVRDWGLVADSTYDISFSTPKSVKGRKVLARMKKENYAEKERLSVAEMLTYKLILSVPGNDKDSGLAWKLISNSVVLMPKPRQESWIVESNLIQNVHYVRLNDDLSNLAEKVDWCLSNPSICADIASNSFEYMQRFRDRSLQIALEIRVLAEYFSHFGRPGFHVFK